jgi:hypothetical protein
MLRITSAQINPTMGEWHLLKRYACGFSDPHALRMMGVLGLYLLLYLRW